MTPERASTEVVAVLVAVGADEPQVLTVDAAGLAALPSGPLLADHRSLQAGLRAWVETQTGQPVGYLEQLYTFADRDRAGAHGRIISVSYLGLTTMTQPGAGWRAWYDFFPWEDRRESMDEATQIYQRLARGNEHRHDPQFQQRCAIAFGEGGRAWSPELCLQRYELLYEAGLIPEAPDPSEPTVTGERMSYDHRRILATGIARLRAKIQYRPVVFELMPEQFTLGQLQATVEALAGFRVHKQNFRRLVQQQELVEETGARTTETGGRPAKLVRFRREVQLERQAAGTKLPIPRAR